MSGKPTHRLSLVLLISGFIALLFFGSYKLAESPAIWYDEGFYTQMALNVAERGAQVIQISPDTFISGALITAGYTLVYPVSAFYEWFGVGVLQGRLVSFIFMIALAIATYVLVRRLFGSWYAAWSVLLLSSFPMLYGNGKSVLGEVPGLFFLFLFLIFIHVLERRAFKDVKFLILAGVAAGFCVVTKPIFILLIPAVFVTWIVRFRSIPLSAATIIIGALSFVAPLVLWAFVQFGAGDSLQDILSFYANPYEVTDVWSTAFGNALRFFTELTPGYVFGSVVVWGGSLWLRKENETPVSVAETTAFFFSLVIMLAFLRLPGWYRYLFPAVIPALVVLPFTATHVYRALQGRFFPALKQFSWIPYCVLFLVILAQFYQVGFTSFVAQYYDSHRTEDSRLVLQEIMGDQTVFFYNVPELVILLPHRNYYQFLHPHKSLRLGEEVLPILAAGEADVVLATIPVYESEPDLFASYEESERMNRYVVLVPKK